MYTSLKIVKKLSHAWMYYPNGLATGFAISKGYLTGDEVTGLVQIVEQGKTKRPEVLLQNITVVDEYTGGVILTFSSLTQLQQQLVLMGNPLMVDTVSGDTATNPNENVFLSKPGFTVELNKITIQPNWIWKLQGVTYTNPTAIEIIVPYAAIGKSRLEYLIPNSNNGFTVVSGIETESVPFAPQIPENGMYVTFYQVTNTSVDNAQGPIDGGIYIRKIENQDFAVNYNAQAVIEQIDLIDNRSSIVVTGAITDIKSINILLEFVRPGKLFYLKNSTGGNLVLHNMAGSGNVKMAFAEGLNYVVSNNEIIHLKLNSTDLKLELVGSRMANKLDKGGYTGTAADLNKKIDDIAFPDGILTRGVATLAAGEVSIPASSFIVRLNQNEVTNVAAFSTPIDPATAGYKRTDIIVLDQFGSFILIEGIESLSIAIKPQAQPNTLEVVSINIDGAVISPPVDTVYTRIAIDDVTGLAAELADKYTKAEVDSKISSVYKFIGNVANYAALPTVGLIIGHVYNLTDTGANYAWTGTVWDKLGDTVDISGKENISNKQNSLAPDGTGVKYVTVDAVNLAFSGKQDTITGTVNRLSKFTATGLADSAILEVDGKIIIPTVGYNPNAVDAFQVNGSGYFTGDLKVADTKKLYFGTESWVGIANPSTFEIRKIGDISFSASADLSRTDNLVIKPSGNVGIGTDYPINKLHVEAHDGSIAIGTGVNTSILAWDGAIGRTIIGNKGDQNWDILFKQNANVRMRIDSVGNISIGEVPIISETPSALLHMVSTNRGFLIPRMTNVQKLGITAPAEGLQVYDLTSKRIEYFDGISWVAGGGTSGEYATTAHTHTFASLTEKPTTLAGYGITSGNIITTLGYTPANDLDVVYKSGVQTITGAKTFSTKVVVTDTTSSVGGASASPVLELNQTWNTTGAPSAISLNITNTASSLNSQLMELKLNNSPRFRVSLGGVLRFGSNADTIFPSSDASYLRLTSGFQGVQLVGITGLTAWNTTGNVTIGTVTVLPSSKFTVESTTQGILIPRMTNTQMLAITGPTEGLQVYDLTNKKLSYFDGVNWIASGGSGGSSNWTKTGDDLVNSNIGFIDVKLQASKKFRILNSAGTEAAYIDETGIGRFGVATTYTSFGSASGNVHLSMVRIQANADFTIGNPQVNQAFIIRSSNYFGTSYWAGSSEASATAVAEHSFNIGNSVGDAITSGIFRIGRTRIQATVPVKYAADLSANYDARSLVDKNYVDNVIRPYKVYMALITQINADAPTVIVLQNTIGAIVWTRSGVGTYTGTLTDGFVLDKTTVQPSMSNGLNAIVGGRILSAGTVGLTTISNGAYVDGVLQTATLEIRVYN